MQSKAPALLRSVFPLVAASSSSCCVVTSRIPKKWKWAGDIFVDVNPDRAERLCSATLSEPSDPRPGGLRLSILLGSVDSLRLAKLYNVHDLYLLLRACDTVQQFAKFGPQSDADADAMKTLTAHMERLRLVSRDTT